MSKPIGTQEKYVDIIDRIDKNYKIMKGMRPLPESALRRYKEESDILNSYCSNAIEGNTFTYDETRLLIKEGVTSTARTMREHNDIIGHSRAYWSLYEAVKEKRVVSEDFIKELHAKVLQGDDYAGKYRDADVYIGDSVSVSYTAPTSDRVPGLMTAYVAKLQPDMAAGIQGTIHTPNPDWVSIFNKVAAHHIDFERIHPFFDGNGRTGRLLLNYELLGMGLLPLNIAMEDRSRYYAGFSAYEAKGRYSTRPESKTETMAKLLAESSLRAMEAWNRMFAGYSAGKINTEYEVYKTISDVIHNKLPESAVKGLKMARSGVEHTILAYDKKDKNCLFEREDGEYLIAKGFPNITGGLDWKKEILFGKGKEGLLKAISTIEVFKAQQKNILE